MRSKLILDAIRNDLDDAAAWEADEGNHQAREAFERALKIVEKHFKDGGIE